MSSTFVSYILLGVAALLPVFATIIFFLLEKFTKFNKLNYWLKQVLFGLVFGGLAVIGTEWGIPMNSAQVNCRDAAVLSAGLLFGWPAGIIAGVIGGVERWFAVYWGVGSGTQLACSVSTLIAGFYAAFIKKVLYKNKRPNLFMCFAIGLVMESFHLLMAFITNVNNPTFAYKVVKACTFPMLLFNGLSVMLSAMVYSIAEKQSLRPKRIKNQNISTTIQISMVITCVLVYGFSSTLVYGVESNMVMDSTKLSLNTELTDLDADVLGYSNDVFTMFADGCAQQAEDNPSHLLDYAIASGACDVNVVNRDGICIASLDTRFYGVDFHSRDDTKDFVPLVYSQTTLHYCQRFQEIPNTGVFRKYVGVKTMNGFVRFGFDIEAIQVYLVPSITRLATNRHVGDTGYAIIADHKYKLVSGPDNISYDIIETDIAALSKEEDYKILTISFNKTASYSIKTTSEGLILIATIGIEASKLSLNMDMYLISFLQIVSYAILFTLIYMLIDGIVLKGFNKVTESLEMISEGNLDVNVDVQTSIEFNKLSKNINTTVGTLKDFIKEANERIDKELKLAKDIQANCLPSVTDVFKNNENIDIYACMFTAKEVGGDFYDFYFNHTYRFNFVIADVSGKGIPASLFMMRSKQELKSLTEADLPIDQVFNKSNNALCEGNDAGMFVTVWQAGIDTRTGKVDFANAGHNAPVLYRKATGRFEFLTSKKGLVMAGLENMIYKPQELQLEEGDIIFMYTDGVTEATNADMKLYGDDRLLKILNSQEYESMEQLCKVVKEDVDKFVGSAPQFDDITMIGFRFKKKVETK